MANNRHIFADHKFQKPVLCKVCAKQVWGFGGSKKQGYICKLCLCAVHKKCAPMAQKRVCQEAMMVDSYVQFKTVIKDNCLKHMQKLLWQIQENSLLSGERPKKLRIMAATVETFDVALGEDMEKVWADKFIQKVFEQKWREWQIPQGADFFFEHGTRLGDPDYKPNSQDVMRARPQEQAKSYKDREFRVWMPQASELFKEALLDDILKQTKAANNINEAVEYNAWNHETGSPIESTAVTLSALGVLEIYYYPAGRSPPTLGVEATRRALLSAREQKGRLSVTSPRGGKRESSKSAKKKDENVEERNGTFTLTIGAAQDLSNNTAWFELLYIVLSNDNNDKQHRSKAVPNCPLPEWNQEFKFPVNCDTLEFTLKIWATNKNPRQADILLGECALPFQKFKDGDRRFAIYRLKKEPKTFKDYPGEIQVNWKYADKKRKMDSSAQLKPIILPTLSLPDFESGSVSARDSPARDGSRDASPRRKKDKERTDSHGHHKKSKDRGGSDSKDSRGRERPEKEKPPKPRTLEDVYDVGEELGSGAFSIVKAGKHKTTGQPVAIKILDNYGNLEDAEEELESFQRETSIMRLLKHDHVVQLLDVFEDDDHYYVVMECVSGGELFDQIIELGNYDEQTCATLIAQVFNGLAYMHERGYAHRDIKPENLLFSDDDHNKLKLVDLGECKLVGEGLTDYVGTPDYMAPEILKGQLYTQLVDTWAMGVVTYIMLCGFPPFDGDSDTDVLCNIMNISYEFPSPEWDDKSDTCKDFVKKLMTESDQRMSAKEALEHPFIKENVGK